MYDIPHTNNFINELENNTILFYFNPSRPDCKLISKSLLRLENEYPLLNFYQIDLDGNQKNNYTYPILLCIDKNVTNRACTYQFSYANVSSLYEVIDRIDLNYND